MNDSPEFLQQFIKDRNAALLSLDRSIIVAYAEKYHIGLPDCDEVFWASIHKARTGVTDFPEEEKQKSKDWLKERNLSHFDDKP